MMNNSIVLTAVTAIVLSLTACASTHRPTAERQSTGFDPTAAAIGAAAIGDTVAAGGLAIDSGMVLVKSEYVAASGNLCRRFSPINTNSITRVACQKQSGVWYIQRSLLPEPSSTQTTTQTATQTTTQSTTQSTTIVPVLGQALPMPQSEADTTPQGATLVVPHIESKHQFETLADGESLWSFSRRVTGNGYHWEQIAELYSITDIHTVVAGTRLLVPDSLLVQ